MAYIRTISHDEAEGDLLRQYDAAVKRAGKVWEIVKLSSLSPRINRIFMQLYIAIMQGESGLSRTERELLATVTSLSPSTPATSGFTSMVRRSRAPAFRATRST